MGHGSIMKVRSVYNSRVFFDDQEKAIFFLSMHVNTILRSTAFVLGFATKCLIHFIWYLLKTLITLKNEPPNVAWIVFLFPHPTLTFCQVTFKSSQQVSKF